MSCCEKLKRRALHRSLTLPPISREAKAATAPRNAQAKAEATAPLGRLASCRGDAAAATTDSIAARSQAPIARGSLSLRSCALRAAYATTFRTTCEGGLISAQSAERGGERERRLMGREITSSSDGIIDVHPAARL